MSQQPSWAHVVRGGGANAPMPPLPQVPHPPPHPPPTPSVKKMAVSISARVLQLAISSLKIPEKMFNDLAGVHKTFIEKFVEDQLKVKAVNDSVNMKNAVEAAGLTLPVGDGLEHSYALALPPSPNAAVDIGSSEPKQLSSSPELHHKLPARLRLESDITDEGSCEDNDGVHTNMFGINFVMWFNLSIEGKSVKDPEEED